MDFSPPRGTQDLVPPRSETLRALSEAAARVATLYGYRFAETPALEPTELFVRTSGETSDVVHREMYTFRDKSRRSLTLRPEGTAGMVRAYLGHQHDLPAPFKAYYLEAMWRYARPQVGRYREFRQFGIEVIGSAGPEADVEVVAVGERFIRGAGVADLTLELNSIGDENCRPAYREELLGYLEANRERLTDEHRDRFRTSPMRVLDCNDQACRDVAKDAPKISDRLCEPCARHFEGVRAGLEREHIAFEHVPTLVRGLDYYTRTAFEWVSPALPEGQATIGGGGRYDGLADLLGGAQTPAVGFAIGLDRVQLVLERERHELPEVGGLDCFVVALGDRARSSARGVADRLREAGISVTMAFETRPLNAQLRMADRAGARFAVILGEREATADTLTWKRLTDGSQYQGGLDEAIAHITARPEAPK